MADGYGNIVAGSWRCHVAAWIVSSTDKTDTIRVQARFQAVNGWNFNINGISGSVKCNGVSGSGTGNANIGTNGEATIFSRDFTVSRGESAKNIACSATVSQYYFNGGSSSASVSVTIPRVAYLKPNPPKNVSFTRVSDTQIRVSWQGNWDNNAGKPWKQIIIDRRKSVAPAGWSTWPTVKTLNWDATSITLTDAQPNGRYQVAVYARNQAGDSSHVDSPVIYTTPDPPKSVTATKLSETSVRVVADATNTYTWSIDFDRSVDGGATWTTISTGQVGTTVTITDTPPATGALKYRARCWRYINGNSGSGLFSGFRESNTLTTITTPLAPTITAPTASVFTKGSTVEIKWALNHPDGTAQTAAQVEITMPDGSLQTRQINDATQNYGLAVTSSGTYKIRVRTKGLAADYGAWSAYKTFQVGTIPDVVVTAPGDTVTGFPLTVSWSVAASSAISEQTLTLTAGNSTKTFSVGGSARSYTVQSSQWLPDNGTTFTIRVTARDGIGLSGSETVSTTTRYTPPARPDADVADVEGYAVAITPTFKLFEGEWGQQYWTTALPDGTSVLADFYTFALSDGTSVLATLDEGRLMAETTHVSVERIHDGTSTTVAESLADGETVVDVIPPLNTDYVYMITAHSATGATASVEKTWHVASNVNVVNFGVDASECLPLGLAQSTDWQAEHDVESFDFADGDPYPVSYASGSRTVKISEQDTKPFEQAEWQRMQRLAENNVFGWYRDASGSRDYVALQMKLAYDVTSMPRTMTCSVDMTKQSWQEPRK